jgi:predicted Ser/Thr protein kinase
MAIDVKALTLVGEGHHGKVYLLDKERCVKVYSKKAFMEMEYKVLKHSERYPHFPIVYVCKDNYMIREYFDGPNLWEYLEHHNLNENIAIQLLKIIDSFIELGYSKIDCHLHHIIVTEGESLKIIDPTTNMSRKSSIPRKLLNTLDKLGNKDKFLEYTEVLRPHYYAEWKHC